MKRISLFFAVSLFLCCFASYRAGQHNGTGDPPPPLQTSIYEWGGDFDGLVEMLCKSNSIDYNDGEFVVSCPKCARGGCRYQQSPTGSIYYGFHTAYPTLEELRPGEAFANDYTKTYCSKCRYPLGTDWHIVDNGKVKLNKGEVDYDGS